MKMSVQMLAALVASAIVTLASCATAPVAPATSQKPAAAPEKVRKERTVTFKTPVLSKQTAFYPDGLVDEYTTFKYDPAARKLLEKASFDPSRSEPVERVVTEWSGDKATAESVFEAEGRLRLRREFGYDAAGHLVAERVLDSKGALQSFSSYAYDAAGNKTEWKVQDAKGILRAVTSYAYQKGALSRIDLKDGSGKPTGSMVLEYDAAAKLAKRSYLAADGSLQKYEAYVYAPATAAQKGALIALETHRPDGSLSSKLGYEYGALGEMVKATEYDGSGAIKGSTSYEYRVREDSRTEVYYE
jgi:YD repeat-containing protein